MFNKIHGLVSFVLIAFLSGCTIQEDTAAERVHYEETHVAIEWVDMLKWNDKKYYYSQEETEALNKDNIGEEIGTITFSVVGSHEESNPEYQLGNGEATFAGEGSKIYSINTIDINEMIIVQNKVYVYR